MNTLNFDPDHVHALARDIDSCAEHLPSIPAPSTPGVPATTEFLAALSAASQRLNTTTHEISLWLRSIAADAHRTAEAARTNDEHLARTLEGLLP